jgi:hypothetical protein
MLDLIGALSTGAATALNAVAILGFAAISRSAKVTFAWFALLWVAALLAIGATGGFAPRSLGPVPAVPLAFALAVVTALIAWNAAPAFRRALLSVPLENLIAANGLRVFGVFFLLLYAQQRLPAPFAQSAGIGDIITGFDALYIAARLTSGRPFSPRWIAAWNAFGALDLVVAVSLGVVSSPGLPIQLFGTSAPNALTSLPWLLIPAMLVPFYLLTHLTIAKRLASTGARAWDRAAHDGGGEARVGTMA